MKNLNVPAHFGQVPTFDALYERSSTDRQQDIPAWLDQHDVQDVVAQDIPRLPAPSSPPAPAQLVRPAHEASSNVAHYQPPVRIYRPPVQAKRPMSEVRFTTKPLAQSSTVIHMARNIGGTREICLISECVDGKHVRYVLRVKQRLELSHQDIPLELPDKPPETTDDLFQPAPLAAIDLATATIVFDQAVAQEFPPTHLKNGRSVPTFVSLM